MLAKPEFPRMIKELLQSMSPGQLLPKAFEKCGLFPVNKEKVLERIPSIKTSQNVAHHIDTALLKNLEVRRFGDASRKKPRGKKVPAGQSHTAEPEDESSPEEQSTTDNSSEEEEEGEREREVIRKNMRTEQQDKEEQSDVDNMQQEKGDEENMQEEEDELDELPDVDTVARKAGTCVVALYEGEWFLAEVCQDQSGVGRGYTRLNYMLIKGINSFAWGVKEDLVVTFNEDIILEKVHPEPVNSRGHLGLSKKDLKNVQSWMVVVYLAIHKIKILRFLSCYVESYQNIFKLFS